MPAPLVTVMWDGEAFRPVTPFNRRQAAEAYGEGEVITVTEASDRSKATHNHQFAQIAEMWQTLPEGLADAPYAVSPDALRKHALIATGHCDVETVDAGSKAAAERVAGTLKKHAEKAHGYAITKLRGPVVILYTPHSQSMRAMGRDLFQRSKSDVLEWIERLLAEDAA